VNIFGINLIPEALMIPCQTEQVLNAQGGRTKDIALHGDAVSVPRNHLHYRLQPHPNEEGTCGNAGHPHNGRLIIRDVNGINVSLEQIGLLFNDSDVVTLWERTAPFY
jgi:hypothetical protein